MQWLFVLIFGVACTAIGAVWGLKRWLLRRNGVRTMGTVVESSISLGIPRIFTPVVEFRTDAGQRVRFRGATGNASEPCYQPGQRVRVIYSRRDPWNAQIDNLEQFWLGPVSIGLFGLIALGVLLFGKV